MHSVGKEYDKNLKYFATGKGWLSWDSSKTDKFMFLVL
jgi:hypothetical protein